MRLMLASRLPSYGSIFKLCTYPLTCVFIGVQVHWLKSLLMSSWKMDRGASPLVGGGLHSNPTRKCQCHRQHEFFSTLHKNYLNAQWLCERAILAPRNDCVACNNNQLLDDFPGDVVVYKLIDSVSDKNAVTDLTKFLNSLELSGMPPHILKLKVGAPVMVLQNINSLYLYNGTQYIVRVLGAIALKWQLPQVIAKDLMFFCHGFP